MVVIQNPDQALPAIRTRLELELEQKSVFLLLIIVTGHL